MFLWLKIKKLNSYKGANELSPMDQKRTSLIAAADTANMEQVRNIWVMKNQLDNKTVRASDILPQLQTPQLLEYLYMNSQSTMTVSYPIKHDCKHDRIIFF